MNHKNKAIMQVGVIFLVVIAISSMLFGYYKKNNSIDYGSKSSISSSAGIENEISLIQKTFEEGNYSEAKKMIDDLLKTNGDDKRVKDFIENSGPGRYYKYGKIVISDNVMQEKFKEFGKMYEEGKYNQIKDSLDMLIKENGKTESIKVYLATTDIGKAYEQGTLGQDLLKSDFEEIHKLYEAKKYDEVKKTLDLLVKTKGESEGVKDFLKSTDIGKAYTQGKMGQDLLKNDFEEIHKLYEAKKYDEVKKKLDLLVKTKGESEGVKDFLKSTDIGKAYTQGKMGQDLLKNDFEEIHKLYEAGKFVELKTKLDSLVKTKGESEGVKDFLKSTDIGKLYMAGNLGQDLLQNEFKEIHVLYEAGKYDEVKKKLDEIVKNRGDKDGVKDFLKTTDIGKQYMAGNLGQDLLQEELNEINKLYLAKKYSEVEKKIDELIRTRGDSEGVKQFLSDDKIGQAYKNGEL